MEKRIPHFLLALLLFPIVRVLTQWAFVSTDSFPPNAAWLFRVSFQISFCVLLVLWFLKVSDKAKLWIYFLAMTLIGPWSILLPAFDLVMREFGWSGFWGMERVLTTGWASAALTIVILVVLLEWALRKKAALKIRRRPVQRHVL